MSYTNSLIEGLAGLIADAGIAVYRPDGVYVDGETGITEAVMPDTPDRIVCLTPYPVEDGALTDTVTGVQARLRAGRDPRDVNALSDDLFGLLHGLQQTTVGGVYVALAWRQSEAWIGQDTKGRMEKTANYYLRTTRISPNAEE